MSRPSKSPRVPQLGGAHADKTENSLAALKQWVNKLDEGQDEAKEDLLGEAMRLKKEACWVPDSEDEGATPSLRRNQPEDVAEPR